MKIYTITESSGCEYIPTGLAFARKLHAMQYAAISSYVETQRDYMETLDYRCNARYGDDASTYALQDRQRRGKGYCPSMFYVSELLVRTALPKNLK